MLSLTFTCMFCAGTLDMHAVPGEVLSVHWGAQQHTTITFTSGVSTHIIPAIMAISPAETKPQTLKP